MVFDHTLRSGDEAEREAKLIREPVLSAHNDYTEWSGPQRVRELMGDEAEGCSSGRFAIIQVWRAINQPIAVEPARHRRRAQRRARGPARSPSGATRIASARPTGCKYNPRHRWFYFPRMRRDEALVFKVYDSEKDGRARFTPQPRSTIRPRRPARRRGRASRRARSRSSRLASFGFLASTKNNEPSPAAARAW